VRRGGRFSGAGPGATDELEEKEEEEEEDHDGFVGWKCTVRKKETS
jgi:hypothetical protein